MITMDIVNNDRCWHGLFFCAFHEHHSIFSSWAVVSIKIHQIKSVMPRCRFPIPVRGDIKFSRLSLRLSQQGTYPRRKRSSCSDSKTCSQIQNMRLPSWPWLVWGWRVMVIHWFVVPGLTSLEPMVWPWLGSLLRRSMFKAFMQDILQTYLKLYLFNWDACKIKFEGFEHTFGMFWMPQMFPGKSIGWSLIPTNLLRVILKPCVSQNDSSPKWNGHNPPDGIFGCECFIDTVHFNHFDMAQVARVSSAWVSLRGVKIIGTAASTFGVVSQAVSGADFGLWLRWVGFFRNVVVS